MPRQPASRLVRLGRRLPGPARRPARAAYLRLLRTRRVRARLANLRRYDALTPPTLDALRYLVSGKELDNFTYDIANLDELASFLAEALEIPEGVARAYVAELEDDDELRRGLDERLARKRDRGDRARFGRRLGWYATVRAVKPRLVVETGVHDGLGSAVLLRALERNAEEGVEGRLVSLDVRPDVGWLVEPRLGGRFELLVGDARELLPQAVAGRAVDVFVHDSDHSYEHETFELETVARSASDGAVLISDNAHAGRAFADFCGRFGLEPHVFLERPVRHFYPGAAIGLTRWREPSGA